MEKRPSSNFLRHSAGWLLFLIVPILAGCSKNGVNCGESTGAIVRMERILPDFDSIIVRDYVNLILTNDPVTKVEVEAGENIIDGITTEVVDNRLEISNNNRCNWLRSYAKPINVYISKDSLQRIEYISSGNITSTNTLRSDTLIVVAEEGCGTIDLDVDLFQGNFVIQKGTVDFNLHGRCAIGSIYSGSTGFFQCKNLETNYMFVTNSGSNDVWVNVKTQLGATINSIGNIYYTGHPPQIDLNMNGTGQLIPF